MRMQTAIQNLKVSVSKAIRTNDLGEMFSDVLNFDLCYHAVVNNNTPVYHPDGHKGKVIGQVVLWGAF